MIYSCAPLEVAREVYKSLIPKVEIRSTLTGYVAEKFVRPKNYTYMEIGPLTLVTGLGNFLFFWGRKALRNLRLAKIS